MIYRIRYDRNLERDVQDVFITEIRLDGKTLFVTNESSERFEMDLASGEGVGLDSAFDRRDVIRVLGYEPPRATLFRVLEQLVVDKWIAVAWHSAGRSSTRYAKLPEPAEETA